MNTVKRQSSGWSGFRLTFVRTFIFNITGVIYHTYIRNKEKSFMQSKVTNSQHFDFKLTGYVWYRILVMMLKSSLSNNKISNVTTFQQINDVTTICVEYVSNLTSISLLNLLNGQNKGLIKMIFSNLHVKIKIVRIMKFWKRINRFMNKHNSKMNNKHIIHK